MAPALESPPADQKVNANSLGSTAADELKKHHRLDNDEWEDSPNMEHSSDEEESETSSLLRKEATVTVVEPETSPQAVQSDEQPGLVSPSVLIALVSAVSAAFYITGSKIATSHTIAAGSHVSFAHLLVIRGFFGLLLISYEVYVLEKTPLLTPPGPENGWKLLALAGLITAAGTGTGLFAVSHWSAPDVATITNTSPALTVVVCAMLGLESMSTKSFVGLFIAIIGVALISKPVFIFGGHVAPGHEFKFLPFLGALSQSVCQVVTNLMIRKIHGASAAATTYYVNLFMLLQGLLMLAVNDTDWPRIDGKNWVPPVVGILMTVVFGTSMNYFKNMALRMSKSILVVGIRFIVPVLCVVTNYVFLDKSATMFTIFGASLVVVGGIIILIAKKDREAAKEKGSGEISLLSPVEIDYISTPKLQGIHGPGIPPVYPAVWQQGDRAFGTCCMPPTENLTEERRAPSLGEPIARVGTMGNLLAFEELDAKEGHADDLEDHAPSEPAPKIRD